MKALILASGKGERLRLLTEHTNKGMLPVGGTPTLEIIVINCAAHGIRDVVFAVGVKKEQVLDYFGERKTYDIGGAPVTVSFEYAIGQEAVGTAGEIAKAKPLLQDESDFLLHYGDALTNLDITAFHRCHKESGAVITGPGMLEVHTESGIYVCDEDGTVRSFHEKPFVNDLLPLPGIFSNVPVYWLSRRIWESPDVTLGRDFNADVVPRFVATGAVQVYCQGDLWHLDIGDLKKYNAICAAYESGRQAALRKLA